MNRFTTKEYKTFAEQSLRTLPSWKEAEVRQAALAEWEEKGGKLLHKPQYNKEKIKYKHAEAAYLELVGTRQVQVVEKSTNIGIQVTGATVYHASGTGKIVKKVTKV
eukprot:scaffold17286_cov76-Amphora_coffeaeformis.AAC.1